MFSVLLLNNNDFISFMESMQSAYELTDICYLDNKSECNNCGNCLK